MSNVTALESQQVLQTYKRQPVVFVRGEGSRLIDEDGKRYLDFISGIGVCVLGHAHPGLAAVIADQSRTLIHISNLYFHPLPGQLAAKLAALSGLQRAFFCNSGTEAVEACLKFARRYFYSKGVKNRTQYVALQHGFSGRSMGALSVTANAHYREPFEPLVPGVTFVNPDDPASLDAAVTEHTAAIIAEPIQGEGGYIVPEDGFLQGLREICDRHGILLIADEIQSGSGRTGAMWAVEHWGVKPDIVLTAKGIASGMPLGAMIARADLMEAWGPGAHGSTFGGNPIACAAALVTIDLLEGGLIANAAARGDEALSGLRQLAVRYDGLVKDVRGKGLMLGVEFDTPEHAEDVQWACFERGLLVLECGVSSVRMSPALIVTEEELRTALRIFGEAVAQVAGHEAEIHRQVVEAGALHEVEAAG